MSKSTIDNIYQTGRFKAIISGAIVGAIIIITGCVIGVMQYRSVLQIEQVETTEVLVLIQKNLQYALREINSVALLLTNTVNDEYEVTDFDKTAARLYEQYPTVNVLEIIKDNTVTHIYPLEGNERVVGYNLENNPRVLEELYIAMDKGSLYLSGPFMLVEQKLGVIGLLPIRQVNDKITAVAVILYFESLLEEAQILTFSDRYDFVLEKQNLLDDSVDLFLTDAKEFDSATYSSIEIEEGNWTLYAKQKNQATANNVLVIICSLSVVLGLLISVLSYKLFKKPFELEYHLDKRTKELYESKESFRKYSELLNSVLQSPEYVYIYSIDQQYNYLAFNKSHQNYINKHLGIEIDEGSNVRDALNDDIKQKLVPLYAKAFEGVEFEEIVKTFENEETVKYWQYWFSPIKDATNKIVGVTVFSVDITKRVVAEKSVEQSLQEKTILLAEIHHRVKNNLAIVSGLLQLQKAEVADEQLSAIFDQSINRIISIAMVHELMYNTKDLSSINVHEYLDKLIPAISATMQSKQQEVKFNIEVQDYRLNINQAIPLGLLLNELITNSFKYAFNGSAQNRIIIELTVEGDLVNVCYADNGRGFPVTVDFNTPKNLGLNLIHAQLKQLDATYQATTVNKFELNFWFRSKEAGSHSHIEV